MSRGGAQRDPREDEIRRRTNRVQRQAPGRVASIPAAAKRLPGTTMAEKTVIWVRNGTYPHTEWLDSIERMVKAGDLANEVRFHDDSRMAYRGGKWSVVECKR